VQRRRGCGLALLCAVALQACVSHPTQPSQSTSAAFADDAVRGLPAEVRYWGDDPAAALQDWRSADAGNPAGCCAGIADRPHSYLAISSGGVEGAYGAGVIAGWTAAGTRPEFQLVTGVSAGAMIAPFAFLGPEYDGALREIYSRYSSKDLVERRSMLATLDVGAAMDSKPLRQLIDRYLGDREIARIAAEGRKGRKLLVGTTSLDAKRPVVWDLTRIAASGSPHARRLIGDVILASASVPGLFPPLRISVEAGNVHFDEWHVDGGVANQLFLAPPGLDWQPLLGQLRVHGQPQVYVIRNARDYPKWTALREFLSPMVPAASPPSPDDAPQPAWSGTNPGISSIFLRSMASMLRTRGFHDAVRFFLATQDDDLAFNIARIPGDVALDSREFYDRVYMQGLFENAYALAAAGYPWLSAEAVLDDNAAPAQP
jgi:hypothetical protein